MSEHTSGLFTMEFKATKSGKLFSQIIKKDSKVIIVLDSKNWEFTINGNKWIIGKDESQYKETVFQEFLMSFYKKTLKATDEDKSKLTATLKSKKYISKELMVIIEEEIQNSEYNFELQDILKKYQKMDLEFSGKTIDQLGEWNKLKPITYTVF